MVSCDRGLCTMSAVRRQVRRTGRRVFFIGQKRSRQRSIMALCASVVRDYVGLTRRSNVVRVAQTIVTTEIRRLSVRVEHCYHHRRRRRQRRHRRRSVGHRYFVVNTRLANLSVTTCAYTAAAICHPANHPPDHSPTTSRRQRTRSRSRRIRPRVSAR